MTKLKVTTIVGTRPEIIRMSEIIKKFDTFFEHRLIHTGQNPDPLLKDIFFKDLELSDPDLCALEVLRLMANRLELFFEDVNLRQLSYSEQVQYKQD